MVFYLFFTYKFPDLCGALEAGGFTDAVIVVILRKRRILVASWLAVAPFPTSSVYSECTGCF